MPKCSNCGAELNAGAKFCEECGTPVPQTKACPKCGAQLKPEAKFCSECGYSFAAKSAPPAKAGVSVGDKNVIAGDVVGESYKIHGNATIVKNEDETKKMVRCHVCGRNILITEAITCVKCGEDTCVDCMDMRVKSCKTCVESANREQDNVYRQAVIHALEDGVITLTERRELKALQKQLGISDAHADEIEDRVRADGSRKQTQTLALSSFEKVSFERAAELFYGQGEADEAFAVLKPIHNRHPDNEEVVSLYADILLRKDLDAARQYLDSLRVDILGVKIVGVDLAFRNGDFADAEMRLDAAERLWPDSVRLQCRRIAFYLLMQMYSGDKSYLDRARSLAESITEGETKLERSEVEATIRTVMGAAGEDFDELTEEECEERGLYFHTASDSMDGEKDDSDDGAENDEEDDDDSDVDSGDDVGVADGIDIEEISDFIKNRYPKIKVGRLHLNFTFRDNSSFDDEWSAISSAISNVYGYAVNKEDAIAIIDCSLIGEAGEGVLIDKTGIYAHNSQNFSNHCGFVDWMTFRASGAIVSLDENPFPIKLCADRKFVIDVFGSCQANTPDAKDFFNRLLSLVRGEAIEG